MHEPLPDWLEAFRAGLGAELVETHISWLLLAGHFAYKFKKPLRLPFLDYGSVAQRRFFCTEELRLNRRFAPGLYVDVITVKGTAEAAVKMRRFAEAGRLDHVCARGELSPERLAELAAVIVDFHDSAAVAAPGSRFGAPEQVLAPALENFAELRTLLPGEDARLSRLHAWTMAEFARCRDRLAARQAAGRVRECHGDLHLGNLVLIDGRVTPFDCIEFNEDLRWIDVASELAFTYIDLLDHRRPGLANWLLNEWLARSGDFDAVPVLRFYAIYRALVRAKVAGIRGDIGEATDYLTMAESLATPPAPRLTIAFGLSGSGKTTATDALLLADPTATTLRLRSDIERKRLHGLTADANSHSDVDAGIYTAAANDRTYARLAELADACLAFGWSVIVDAAFLKRARREEFRALAEARRAHFAILACVAPVETLRQRLTERRGDASEASLAVLEQQCRRVEALADDELPAVIVG